MTQVVPLQRDAGLLVGRQVLQIIPLAVEDPQGAAVGVGGELVLEQTRNRRRQLIGRFDLLGGCGQRRRGQDTKHDSHWGHTV